MFQFSYYSNYLYDYQKYICDYFESICLQINSQKMQNLDKAEHGFEEVQVLQLNSSNFKKIRCNSQENNLFFSDYFILFLQFAELHNPICNSVHVLTSISSTRVKCVGSFSKTNTFCVHSIYKRRLKPQSPRFWVCPRFCPAHNCMLLSWWQRLLVHNRAL